MTWQIALDMFTCVVGWCEEESNKINSKCEFCENDAARGW